MSQLPQARPLFPPGSLFPGEEGGIWPDASDVQISAATDTDVRKSQPSGFGACAGHLCSPCVHISIQEMISKTRASPAPCPYPTDQKTKVQKKSLFASESTAAKFRTFVVWYPHKNTSLKGRDRNACVVCRSEGPAQESLAADRRHYIYSPPAWQQTALLYCMWESQPPAAIFQSSFWNTRHIWRLRNSPAQPANISQHRDGDEPAIQVAETLTAFLLLVLIFKLLFYLA